MLRVRHARPARGCLPAGVGFWPTRASRSRIRPAITQPVLYRCLTAMVHGSSHPEGPCAIIRSPGAPCPLPDRPGLDAGRGVWASSFSSSAFSTTWRPAGAPQAPRVSTPARSARATTSAAPANAAARTCPSGAHAATEARQMSLPDWARNLRCGPASSLHRDLHARVVAGCDDIGRRGPPGLQASGHDVLRASATACLASRVPGGV